MTREFVNYWPLITAMIASGIALGEISYLSARFIGIPLSLVNELIFSRRNTAI